MEDKVLYTSWWGNEGSKYKLEHRIRYGRLGRAGSKVHCLHVELIVDVEGTIENHRQGTYGHTFLQRKARGDTRPVYLSVNSACNGNGQHNSQAFEELTEADITCERCKPSLKKKSVSDIARELLDSEHNNGFGIRAFAVTQACEKYGVDSKELIAEIIKQGNQIETEDNEQ